MGKGAGSSGRQGKRRAETAGNDGEREKHLRGPKSGAGGGWSNAKEDMAGGGRDRGKGSDAAALPENDTGRSRANVAVKQEYDDDTGGSGGAMQVDDTGSSSHTFVKVKVEEEDPGSSSEAVATMAEEDTGSSEDEDKYEDEDEDEDEDEPMAARAAISYDSASATRSKYMVGASGSGSSSAKMGKENSAAAYEDAMQRLQEDNARLQQELSKRSKSSGKGNKNQDSDCSGNSGGGSSSQKAQPGQPEGQAEMLASLAASQASLVQLILKGALTGSTPGAGAGESPTVQTVTVSEKEAKKVHTNQMMMAHYSALGADPFFTSPAGKAQVRRWAGAMVVRERGLAPGTNVIFEGFEEVFKKPVPFGCAEQALKGRVLGSMGGLVQVHVHGEFDTICQAHPDMTNISMKLAGTLSQGWSGITGLRSDFLDNCGSKDELQSFLEGGDCTLADPIKNMIMLLRNMKFRRFGVEGDDFSTLTCADNVPIDDDRRPHFGILFWIYLQAIFGEWIGLKQFTWPSRPRLDEDMDFEELSSRNIGGFSVFSMQTIAWMDFIMAKATIRSKKSMAMRELTVKTRMYKFKGYYNSPTVVQEFKDKLENHSQRFVLKKIS